VAQLRVKIGDRVSEGSVLLTLESDGAAPSDDGAAAEAPPASETKVEREPAPPPPSSSDGAGGDHEFQVVVIGSGPGGYTAAFRAADLGLKTALVERYDRLGGVCLNVGCIPSKALLHAARVVSEAEEMAEHGIKFGKAKVDLDALREWKQSVVKRLTGGLDGLAKQRKVEVIHGRASLTGPNTVSVGDREVSFDNCIIAAGSEAATLPGLPDDERIIDSTGALEIASVPKRLLVVGGGIIGLEMATVYDALGAKVTIVEMLEQLIPGCDPDLVKPLQKRISGRYETIAGHPGDLRQGAAKRAQGRVLRWHLAAVRPAPRRRRPHSERRQAQGRGCRHPGRRPWLYPGRSADAHQCAQHLRDRRHCRCADARP